MRFTGKPYSSMSRQLTELVLSGLAANVLANSTATPVALSSSRLVFRVQHHNERQLKWVGLSLSLEAWEGSGMRF